MLCIKYCAPNMAYVDKAQQIKIDYRHQDETLEEFVLRNKDKHIYIDISHIDNIFKHKDYIQRLQKLKEQADNWTLQISMTDIIDVNLFIKKKILNTTYLDAVKEIAPHFMFADQILSWEELSFVSSFNPSEIYISGSLGFQLSSVKKYCDEHNMGIRFIANKAQGMWFETDITRFFIRPEDCKLYEKYGVIEFEGGANVQEVAYKAYTKGEWIGDLRELIIDLDENEPIKNTLLPTNFGEYRLKCGRKCKRGGNCTLCSTMREMAEILMKGIEHDNIINGI